MQTTRRTEVVTDVPIDAQARPVADADANDALLLAEGSKVGRR